MCVPRERAPTKTNSSTSAAAPPPPMERESEEGGIEIREFQEEDTEQVHALFRDGMEKLVPVFTQKLVTDPVFFLPVGGLAWIAKMGVARALSMVSSSSNKGQDRASSRESSWMPLLASAGTVVASVLVAYGVGARMMGGYIQRSIATDLADIRASYFKQGGTFLVAEDLVTGQLVGCVGGEIKLQKEDKKMFELRRMSVDSKIQRRGLGTRLVRSLEDSLVKSGCRHLCMGISSLQVSLGKISL